MKRTLFFILLIILGLNAGVSAADPPSPLAHQVLNFSGRDRGIALVADGSGLAPSLVAVSGLVVVDQQPDETRRAAAAQAADAAGMLGRRLYVAIGSPSACVLADGYADLVVQTTATDKNLTPENAKELTRVVAPYGGTLVVGNSDAAKAGLTRAALESWVKQLDGKTEIRADGSSLWAVWKRPALPGGDDWTHWYYDAGGNPASKDSALIYPFEFAWTAKPMQTTRTQNRAAADGRLFTLFRPHQKEGMFQTHRFEGGDEVIARSLANGEILWRYPLGDDAYAMRSSLIATPEAVYVMRREKVLVLDPQTGKERPPIVLATAPGEVKTMALRDGILVAVVGSTRDGPEFCPTANVQATIDKFKKITAAASYGFGDTLAAWDVKGGKAAWRWQAPAPLDGRIFGISPGGVVLAYAKDQAVVGLNLKDGKELWQQKDQAVLANIAKLDPSEHWGYNMVSRSGLAMTDLVALIAHGGSAQAVALAPKDGTLLWTAKRNNQFPVQAVIVGDRIVATSLEPGKFLEATTGQNALPDSAKKLPLSGANNASCGQVTAAGRYVMGCSGGPLWEMEYQKPLMPLLVKAECSLGNLVADGTFIQVPGACSGCNRIMGYLAMRSFSHIDLHVPADAPGRLLDGTGTPGPAVAADPKDWPTRRHDATRSGGSLVKVPAKAAIRWRWTPAAPYPTVADNVANMLPLETEFRPTQPVSMGDLVVVAGGDGVVTALDRATGKERWRARLGGGIRNSPTLAGGRVVVGAADGTVSALSTADGSLLWRYRLAPVDRRVMSYGHLESSWPVVCSPLVAEDTVYAAAGRPMMPGGYIAALDLATGQPRWLQSYIPYSIDDLPAEDRMHLKDPAQTWLVPYGELALQGDRLVIRTRSSTSYAGLILDRRTGKPATKQTIFDHDLGHGRLPGGEAAILPDGMILGGSYEVNLDQNACAYRLADFGAATVDTDGSIRFGSLAEKGTGGWQGAYKFPPCWNDKILAQPGFGAWGLEAFDLAAWQADITPQLVARPPYGFTAKVGIKPLWGPVAPDTAATVANKYGKVGTGAMAVVLGADAVVATSRKQVPLDSGPFKGESIKLAKIVGGQVTALEAATGSLRWEVELPTAPALDALSLDREGNAILGLQDGSVVSVGNQPD